MTNDMIFTVVSLGIVGTLVILLINQIKERKRTEIILISKEMQEPQKLSDKIKSEIKDAIKSFGIPVFIMIMLSTNYFNSKYFDIPQMLFDNLNIATKGVKQPHRTMEDYDPMGVVFYDYDNLTPELLTTILNNLQAQKDWQKVPKDKIEYAENTIVEYCNQDILISVIQEDMKLSVSSEWSRNSYCYQEYKKVSNK